MLMVSVCVCVYCVMCVYVCIYPVCVYSVCVCIHECVCNSSSVLPCPQGADLLGGPEGSCVGHPGEPHSRADTKGVRG